MTNVSLFVGHYFQVIEEITNKVYKYYSHHLIHNYYETNNVAPLQTKCSVGFFMSEKNIYIYFLQKAMTHTLALLFRIDESANSFTNISLFLIYVLIVYTFQVTQAKTNSLYIDIFNKISLNKTNK